MDTNIQALVGRSLEDLFAYACAMEQEAARRYAQLTKIMVQHGNPEVAQLFRRLECIEAMHSTSVETAARESRVVISAPSAVIGLGLAGAEVADFEDMHYLHRPRQALELARQFEQRAVQFYDELARHTERVDVRAAAYRLADEERSHVRELDRWLARYPQVEDGWDEDPDPVVELE
ncbi:ferritin-like domain-containing protein [Paraburkholderia dinghuensis]|uniref:Rubrerythrin n=1 Tax=Paraburkholderia dinghuensis TaxID=2305225 RepID=A0A3N6MMF8_9BURK|nr:ferritin family protein [Paraburkholderia dinghuensis]RQH04889.1 rubrerythrin [Paraburkholderia dinghuensis]